MLTVPQGSESQQNLAYWTGSNYIGIGPGKVFLCFSNCAATKDFEHGQRSTL